MVVKLIINFKFLKVQMNSTWWWLLASLASIFIIVPDVIGPKAFSQFSYHYAGGPTNKIGAGGLVFSILVVSGIMTLSFIFVLLLIYKLFIKEIDRGYIGSWLVVVGPNYWTILV